MLSHTGNAVASDKLTESFSLLFLKGHGSPLGCRSRRGCLGPISTWRISSVDVEQKRAPNLWCDTGTVQILEVENGLA
jgi:hypothetical protein